MRFQIWRGISIRSRRHREPTRNPVPRYFSAHFPLTTAENCPKSSLEGFLVTPSLGMVGGKVSPLAVTPRSTKSLASSMAQL